MSVTGGSRFANRYELVAFSNGGSLIAGARPNGSLHLVDTATGKVVHTLREGGDSLSHYENALWNTKTGDLLATLSDQDRQPCEGSAPQPLDPLSAVLAVDFSPSGRMLTSQDRYGVVRVWQVSSHHVLYTLPFNLYADIQSSKPSAILPPTIKLVRFSPDGRFLVSSSGSSQNGEFYQMYLVWNAASGRLLRAFSLPGVGAFAFLPDGNLVVAQASKGRVKVENWALRLHYRVPFISSAQQPVGPTDPGLSQAYEDSEIGILSFFQSNLGRYVGGIGKGFFPTKLEDLGKDPRGAGEFRQEISGYRNIYTPGPPDDQGHITSYVLSARPLLYQQTGTRSFLVDQTGQVHATEEAREATTSDAVFRTLPDAVQVATTVQKAAPPQNAPAVQTVTPTSDAPTRVDCSSERSLRAGTGEATKIQFVNRSSQSIRIFWLNQYGARVLYKTLNSGESYLQDTFLTHPWVITNFAGECQAIYMPTRGTSTVEYQ
ncbi:MAG: hypothetical protein DMG49_01235 [Acidobacteria bacterium]|nr:MAG: hypothetical protein DMG49_01235 [Acidobacteriota bacterium]